MAMITVGDYEIGADQMNVVVSRKKPGAKRLITEGYFSTMVDALDFVVDKGVRDTDLVDLKTVVDKQDELYRLIQGLDLGKVKL
jgi:hypothetical protein